MKDDRFKRENKMKGTYTAAVGLYQCQAVKINPLEGKDYIYSSYTCL